MALTIKLSDIKGKSSPIDVDEAVRRMQLPALDNRSATETLDATIKKYHADALAWEEQERRHKAMYGGLVGPGAELYRELARMDEAAHMPHSALSLAERLSGNLYAAGIDRDIQSIANRIAGVVPATIPGAHNRYIESIVNSAAALTRMAESPVLGAFNHYIDSFSASALAADRHLTIFSELDAASRSSAINSLYTGIVGFDQSAEQRLLQAAGMMRAPWAEIGNPSRSLGVLHNYMEIGRYVGSPDSYSESATEFLRSRFGDWRDVGSIPTDSLLDPLARYDLYVDRGFDEDLTDAPDEVVEEEVVASGLPINWAAVFEVKELAVANTPMRALENSRVARDYIGNFEIYLRTIIDRLMTDAFGPKWYRTRLPNNMLDGWLAQRDVDRNNGRPDEPILNYSQLADLGQIICKQDNFREVFQRYIRRRQDVQETFERLVPIRNVAAHNRIILPGELIIMTAEIQRFVMATWAVLKA